MRHMLFYWRNSHVRTHNWQKLLVNAARDVVILVASPKPKQKKIPKQISA